MVSLSCLSKLSVNSCVNLDLVQSKIGVKFSVQIFINFDVIATDIANARLKALTSKKRSINLQTWVSAVKPVCQNVLTQLVIAM
jgi:hypothetical protein